MRSRATLFWMLLIIVAAFAGQAFAGGEQAFSQGLELLTKGEVREAIDLLKPAVGADPESGPLARLLASAYLADGNEFWAMKTLNSHAALTMDCETLSWIAWLQMQKGELDRAEETLGLAEGCGPGPAATRVELLRSMLLLLRREGDAAQEKLAGARRADAMFREDSELLKYVENGADPGRITPLQFRLEPGVGWESNALLSSIAEEQAEEVESAFFSLDHDGRFVWPLTRIFRPAGEYRVRLKSYSETAAADVSFYEFGGKAGFMLGYEPPRASFYYSGEVLMLAGADVYDAGPRWFTERHRGEVEFEALGWLFAFGGAGKSIFRERARTRYEYDLGVGFSQRLPLRISLMEVLAGRMYDAQIDAYDLLGGSALVSVQIPYYRDGFVRLAGAWSIDDYPDSELYFDPEETRTDYLARVLPAVWSPSYKGFRAGLLYKYTQRDSSVEDYSFVDHEIVLKVSWRIGFDPWRPKRVRGEMHVPLEYSLGVSGEYGERIQDLLRQEDAAKRSSSCID